jgi:CPA1 family monovalent cation:H+ antiporter
MPEIEVILALLVAATILIGLAQRLGIPYPILLVIGGLALGFVPGLPEVPPLRPDLVFLIFLPPLLMYAAYFTSIRDFRANLRPIGLLAVGLVLFTTVGVAVVAHAVIDGLSWPAAFVLGAIVSPPDAVAATSIAQRLNLPRRLVTVLEGESLVNDATALVALGVALGAVGGQAFSPLGAFLEFLGAGLGGVVIGLALGWVTVHIWRFVIDTSISITASFLATYSAYLIAERFHVSGVIAVVALGLYLGRHGDRSFSPQSRVEGVAVWTLFVFLLNALVFILIGLQLRRILDSLQELPVASVGRLAWYALAVSAAVIVLRIIWMFPATYLPRLLFRRVRDRDPYPNWRLPAILSWTGMRGVVSLAAALALPLQPASPAGLPVTTRDLIIFLTFCVILATLVLQGLTLPPLIRWLGVADDGGGEREETKARYVAARAGLQRLQELASEDWVAQEMVDDLGLHYESRSRRFKARYRGDGDGTDEEQAAAYERLQQELLEAELRAVVKLRDDGVINDEALRRVQRDLDLERLRLDGPTRNGAG